MKKTFFARYALLVLMVVFFLAPFALRGARMALQRMKNDVKDWLPADFAETQELQWFRDHFLGEQFVVVSWEGCTGRLDDERFMTLVDKFFPETPPSLRPADEAEQALPKRAQFIDQQLGMYIRQLQPSDLPLPDDFVGNRLGLRLAKDLHFNWGGRQEKWLKGFDQQWYYVTPDGDLFRWSSSNSVFGPLLHAFRRHVLDEPLAGELVRSFGPQDGPWFYADPRRLRARLFKSVTTGPGVLHELTRPGGALEGQPEEAMERLEGTLFGPQGVQTCLVVTLTDAAKRELQMVLGRGIMGRTRGQLLELAEESGVHPPPPPQLLPPPLSWIVGDPPAPAPPVIKLGGPPVDNVAIDEEGQITLVRLVGLSVAVGLGLSMLAFRSLAVTVMVFFVGGVSALASLSIVYWSNFSVDAVLMSMPSLVYVLGLSGAVHIVNYYRESVQEHGLRGAPERALRLGWKPCTLAALTTSLGLLSLYTSNILPIRKFGLFSAIGVLATLLLLFSYLPAALQLWPPRRFHQHRAQSDASFEKLVTGFWQRLGQIVVQRHLLVGSTCLLLMIGIGLGLTRINTNVQLLKLFDEDAKIIGDYAWLERNLGRLVPMEIVVRVDEALLREARELPEEAPAEEAVDRPPASASTEHAEKFGLTFLDRLEIVENVQNVLIRQFGPRGEDVIGQTMSAVTFAPPLPDPGSRLRGGYSGRLLARRDEFLASDFLRIDQETDAELWRISLRVGALTDVDYGRFVNHLKRAVEPVLAAYAHRTEILRQLDQQNQGEGYRGADVYLFGARLGPSRTARQLREGGSAEDPSPTGAPALAEPAAEEQNTIFAATLWQLLRNAGLNIDWYDPRFEIPADLPQVLQQQDAVVMLEPQAPYTAEQLRQATSLVIPAGDYAFQPEHDQTAAHRVPSPAAVSAIYTGVVPVVYKAQRTLLTSLIESTGWAFVMIAVVMVIVVRSLSAGLLSMIPNVFPVVILFGSMGWADVMVDIGTMMTASVAMGVAVDDTIHFWTWFRRGLDRGLDRSDAIMLAYRHVAMAMTQTTAIGGLGLAVFAFSTFTPTQRFGVLMLALLGIALVGDLIFLPALLASPLGRVFERKRRSAAAPEPAPPSAAAPPEPHAGGPHAHRTDKPSSISRHRRRK